ncbi:rhamnan synthesis F family protein [Paracoccus indicus]|uniref:rhamnan synthesis F family protein n=1 Tax=Paracoccus indicus TaxID=2079229 RepID=UPI0013B4607A|nr:rhamnan synthesis F family protein [Paracoccus indicus]
MHFHITTNSTRAGAERWGDVFFARDLAEALALQGAQATILTRGEDPKPVEGPAVHLKINGPHLEDATPGIANISWMISPATFACPQMLGRFQLVLSASARQAADLARSGLDARLMHQATNTRRFHPSHRPASAETIPVLFVGAYAPRARRRLVTNAIKLGFDVHVHGPGWQGVIPDRCWKGERVPPGQLPGLYASARVILNSHMPTMIEQGIMSNRSFDALAAGAVVVSDLIEGFQAPDIPELMQAGTTEELGRMLTAALQGPPADMQQRLDLHRRVARDFGFDGVAGRLIAMAGDLVAAGTVAPFAFARGPDPQPMPDLVAPERSAREQQKGMAQAALQISRIAAALAGPEPTPATPPAPPETQGVIHALMADLRIAQAAAMDPHATDLTRTMERPAARAQRLLEAVAKGSGAHHALQHPAQRDANMIRIMRNEPLWHGSPDHYLRDPLKRHLRLWPRRAPVPLKRPVGVFLHLYYDELAPVFADRLSRIDAPMRLYVSTDTEAKAARLKQVLPDAEIRVMANRGRDICPKFVGFADRHDDHDIVLHLHGKRSVHSDRLDDWLTHNLDCLLPRRDEINRILSMFDDIAQLGIVAPVIFRNVIGAAHWGDNFDIAREVAHRMGLGDALPDDTRLRFPAGSMFWARVDAIRPLLDLGLTPDHFPPELGQVDGTLAHAIERMIGVCCAAQDLRMLPVAGRGVNQFKPFQQRRTCNGDVRAALLAGEFDES